MTWYARVPDPFRKSVHFFSLGTVSKSEAKRILQDRIKAGDFDIKDKRETATLREVAEKFGAYERAKGTKSRSLETMFQAIKMLEPLFSKPFSKITTQEISETFMSAAEGIAPITYRNRKAIISTFFNYAVDVLELAQRNPINKAIPRRKIPKKKHDFWTKEQVDRIIANAPTPRTRLLWSFMAFAGLRKSEAEAMKPEMIRDGYIYIKGKGDKEARVPVSPRLQREIDRYDGEWTFYYSPACLTTAARIAIPEGFAGKAHAHRFRYSFCSNLARAGVSVPVIQSLMRHESVTMTIDTYCSVMDDDNEKAIKETFK